MKLTQLERQMLINQNLILARLYPEEKGKYERAAEIAREGYEGYYEAFDTVSPAVIELMGEPVPSEVSSQVSIIFVGFKGLEAAIARLSPEEKSKLDLEELTFKGFNKNDELSHGVLARFMVERMGEHGHMKGRDMLSHSPLHSVVSYIHLAGLYNQKWRQKGDHQDVNFEDLKEIAQGSRQFRTNKR